MAPKNATRILVFAMAALAYLGCKASTAEQPQPALSPEKNMNHDIKDAVKAIGKARVYFNHKSVGDNILTGLERAATGHGSLDIRKVDESSGELSGAYFAHSTMGENGNPESKIQAFERLIDEILRPLPQVALMKLCYVDITSGTDVEALFQSYRAMVERLQTKRPEVALIHLTVPLTVRDAGWKGKIKQITGFRDETARANIKREQYNRLVRSAYRGANLFDLAELEATWPDGRRETFERDGDSYPSLVPLYTNDRGHLNTRGQDRVARGLIRTLHEVIRRPKAENG